MYGNQPYLLPLDSFIPTQGVVKTRADFDAELSSGIALLGICENYQANTIQAMISEAAAKFSHLIVYPTTTLDAYNMYPRDWRNHRTEGLKSTVNQMAAKKTRQLQVIIAKLPDNHRTKVTLLSWEQVLARPEYQKYYDATRVLLNSKVPSHQGADFTTFLNTIKPILDLSVLPVQNHATVSAQTTYFSSAFTRATQSAMRRKRHETEQKVFKTEMGKEANKNFQLRIREDLTYEELLINAIQAINLGQIKNLLEILAPQNNELPKLREILNTASAQSQNGAASKNTTQQLQQNIQENSEELIQEAACLSESFVYKSLYFALIDRDFDKVKAILTLFKSLSIGKIAPTNSEYDIQQTEKSIKQLSAVLATVDEKVKTLRNEEAWLDNTYAYQLEETAHLATLISVINEFLSPSQSKTSLYFLYTHDLTVPGKENAMFLVGRDMAKKLNYTFDQAIVTDKDAAAKHYTNAAPTHALSPTALPIASGDLNHFMNLIYKLTIQLSDMQARLGQQHSVASSANNHHLTTTQPQPVQGSSGSVRRIQTGTISPIFIGGSNSSWQGTSGSRSAPSTPYSRSQALPKRQISQGQTFEAITEQDQVFMPPFPGLTYQKK